MTPTCAVWDAFGEPVVEVGARRMDIWITTTTPSVRKGGGHAAPYGFKSAPHGFSSVRRKNDAARSRTLQRSKAS
jgi:hypothetical protein